jgi:hypothetical protein
MIPPIGRGGKPLGVEDGTEVATNEPGPVLLNLYITPMQCLRLLSTIHQDTDGITLLGSAGYDAGIGFKLAAFPS